MGPKRASTKGLFARSSYDADAAEYASVPTTVPRDSSDHDSDSSDSVHDDADDLDHEVLREEEEREKLLSRGGLFGSAGRKIRVGPKIGGGRRKKNTKDAKAMMGGKNLSMEGSGYGSGTEGEEDEESDIEELLGEKEMLDKKPRKPTVRKILLFTVLLMAFLIILIFSSLGLSIHSSTSAATALVFSNGTHGYAKTTILISLDGMRADFLARGLTPTLNSFINSGVSPPYMLPSFPSVTFPNHWTIATGLFPESHGIVGNSFFDPALQREFYYTDPARSLQTEWWGGEPIWMTAEKQGLQAAVHMWPGSEALGWGATIVDEFNGTEALTRKVNRILTWLDAPAHKRPQLIAAYVPNVDQSGHKFGPNSTETDLEVSAVDSMLHDLFLGLDARNLTSIVNIVIVSDHGMASTSNDRLLYLEDLLDPAQMAHTDGWPLYGLRPKPEANITAIHQSLRKKQDDTVPEAERPWNVYLRDVDMPSRWHFSANPRIAPLWIIPKTGWAIVTEKEHPRGTQTPFQPKGLHGYDNEHPLMRAMFVARGPAFAHLHGQGQEWLALDRHSGKIQLNETITKGKVKSGRVVPFTNVEVYRMVCQSLGIEQAVSNASLPLGIMDLKVLEDSESDDDKSALTSTSPASSSTASSPTSSTSITTSASFQTPSRPTTKPGKVIEVSPGAPPPEAPTKGKQGDKEKNPDDMDWWEYLKHKADRMKEKLKGWWGGFIANAGKEGEGKEEWNGEEGLIVVDQPTDVDAKKNGKGP